MPLSHSVSKKTSPTVVVLKTMKNVSDSLTLQQVFKVHKQKHGVCENTHKLFDQTIHNELLEWSISEPSASATLAE